MSKTSSLFNHSKSASRVLPRVERRLDRRTFLAGSTSVLACTSLPSLLAAQAADSPVDSGTRFRRIATQFVAALADPQATAGDNAQQWGLWTRDPGPRGVRLDRYDRLEAANGVAPAGWKFDDTDWWLEENGLIMEQPAFPLAPGQYVVTGDRDVTTVLTVHPENAKGACHWQLDGGATVYDVTHLRCRSARYTPAAGEASCTPASVNAAQFPVSPGAVMPAVPGCSKQDYAVLFVIAVPVEA